MVDPLGLEPLNVPRLLRQFDLHPDKRLGQTFLIDPVALERVVQSAEINREDSVLEVGPGLGSLTRYLACLAQNVVAIELDTRLIPVLEGVLAHFKNVHIVQGDILQFDPIRLVGVPGYLVVANIPYYITSTLIRHLLEAKIPPKRVVLTVQYEVAQRICAQPGEMSLLALSVQVYGKPQIAVRIPAGAFYPVPKVDSAAVRVDLYERPIFPPFQMEAFFQLTRAGFGQKRKILKNALVAGLGWPPWRAEEMIRAAGLDPARRAQSLSLDEWQALVGSYLSERSGPNSQ